MLSLGTEVFLAFWTASNRVGLPAGSPPPCFAATSMFLISLAKSLPRLASIAAFLCLVVAHLEWPDMSPSIRRFVCTSSGRAHQVHEHAVHPAVAADLGMERGRHQGALTDRDDPTRGGPVLHPGQHLDVVVDRLDPRRADEDRSHVPKAGSPPRTASRSGSSRSKILASLTIVVDSPPGRTRPSHAASSAGRRTEIGSAPSDRRTARCSRTSPCSASTPMVGFTDADPRTDLPTQA